MKNYNSITYWEPFIQKNKTLRERIFKDSDISNETIYLHYTIFTKKSGVENGWVPAPNLGAFIGYVQYCFLPEAYYTWVYGRDKVITKVPIETVDSIFSTALRENKLSKDDEKHMKRDIDNIKRLWRIRKENCRAEIERFCALFNSNWIGDAHSFLYMKAFFNSEELGKFIIDTVNQTNVIECLKKEIGMDKNQWLKFCGEASKDKEKGEKLKGYLFKELKDII